MTNLPVASPQYRSPHSVWTLPAVMLGVSLLALLAAYIWEPLAKLLYLIPYTFLGNSLAPLPYDGALVYLGGQYPLAVIVAVAVVATVIIEAWNMEVLGRILAREGTRGFRNHELTQWSLRWYRKAPFLTLVATCILPIIPHYPMRFLAVLAGYSLWKYQLSVVLGRGARYLGLAGVGVAMPIPGHWLLLASVIALAFGVKSAKKMNRTAETGHTHPPALPEEA